MASKLNTRPERCITDHNNCQTKKKISTTMEPTTVHACKSPRPHSKWKHTWRMLMPRAKNVLKNHDALFWINLYVATKSHTRSRYNVSGISDTRDKMTTITTTTNSEKQLAKLHTTRFLCTFLPSMCRTRNNRNTNGTKKQSEKPSEKQKTQIAITEANNKFLPQHHLQATSTLHSTNALNKLIRFVVSFGDHVHRWRTCRCRTERITA